MKKKLISVLLIIMVMSLVLKNKTIKQTFLLEVENQLAESPFNNEVFTEEDIANLPNPVQRYFRYCGYIGKAKMENAKIVFGDIDFKLASDKAPVKMKAIQYNFVSNPTRIVYMKTSLFGVIPFEGRDKYQNEEGVMTGELLKVVTVFDEKGVEMNQSGLVTVLAETLFVPNYALQNYINWEEVDDNRAKAIIKHAGVKAEGVFRFNDKGEMIRFETYDRYMDKGEGVFEKERWTAEVSEYVEKNGIKVPGRVKAIWNLVEGDDVYFDGQIVDLEYNISEIK